MEGTHFIDCMVRGDASVWDDLLPELRRIALGACRDLRVFDQLREDIVQDVALKVFSDWRNYRSESKLGTWIYSIARNRCIDELRKRVVRGDDRLPEVTDEQTAGHGGQAYRPSLEQTLCVQQVIAALESQGEARQHSKRMVEVLMWWVENDPTTEELASFLGTTTLGAAKERKSSILRHVRDLCRRFCGHDKCAIGASL